MSTPKTKDALSILKNIGKAVGKDRIATGKKPYSILALPSNEKNIQKSFANLPSVTVEMVQNLSVLDIINRKYLLLVGPEATLAFLEAKKTKKS